MNDFMKKLLNIVNSLKIHFTKNTFSRINFDYFKKMINWGCTY